MPKFYVLIKDEYGSAIPILDDVGNLVLFADEWKAHAAGGDDDDGDEFGYAVCELPFPPWEDDEDEDDEDEDDEDDDEDDMDIQVGGPAMSDEEVASLSKKHEANRPILGPIVYGECPEEDDSYRYIDDKRDDTNMAGARVRCMGYQEYHWVVWVPGSSLVLDQGTAWSLAKAWGEAGKVAKTAYRTE